MSELEPPVEPRELPAEVAQLRAAVAAENERLDALYQPRIDAHAEALAAEVEQLSEIRFPLGSLPWRTRLRSRASLPG